MLFTEFARAFMRNGLPRDEVIRATVVPVSQPSTSGDWLHYGAWTLEYGITRCKRAVSSFSCP